MAALDIAIVGPAIPAIRDYFAVSDRLVPWVLNVFVLFSLLGVPVVTRLADSYGRRYVLMFDVILFGIGSVVVASAATFPMLLVGRSLQGLGVSGLFPISTAVVADTHDESSRGRALGVLGSVFGLAFIVGPIAAGFLLKLGWRYLFLLNLPLVVISAVAVFRVIPAQAQTLRRKFDYLGVSLTGIALLALSFGVNLLDVDAFPSTLITGPSGVLFLAAIATTVLLVRVEGRSPSPLIDTELFLRGRVRRALLLTVGAGLCEASLVFVPALAESTFMVDKSTASFMFVPLAAAVAVGAPVGGRLLDSRGPRAIAVGCSVLMIAGLTMLSMAPQIHVLFYVGSVFLGLALAGLLGSSLNFILLEEAPPTIRASSQGLVTLVLNVGLLLGGSLVGAVAASGEGRSYGTTFAVLAVVAVGMTVIALGLGRGRESPS
jgi:MFS family permease